jgi:hypothetical protein
MPGDRLTRPSGKRAAPADAAISSISGNSNISILETMDFDHFYFGTAVFTANFARPPLEAETFIKEIFDEHDPLSSLRRQADDRPAFRHEWFW